METPQLFLYENSLKLTKSAELYKIVTVVISSFDLTFKNLLIFLRYCTIPFESIFEHLIQMTYTSLSFR